MPTRKTKDLTSNEIISIVSEVIGKNPLSTPFKVTEDNYHRGYDYNSRQNAQSKTRWDCSEMSAALMSATIKDMNSMVNMKWKTDLTKLSSVFAASSTTVGQVAGLEGMGLKPLSTNKNDMKKMLEPGMTIYMKYTPRAGSSYSGHVGTVVRDPKSNKLMIAESIGGSNNIGVVMRDVDDFFGKGIAAKSTTTWKLFDPLSKDREALKKIDNKALQLAGLYNDAEKEYKNGGITRVSGGGNQKREFIKNYLIENMNSEPTSNRPMSLNEKAIRDANAALVNEATGIQLNPTKHKNEIRM